MSVTHWAGFKSLRDINEEESNPYVLPIILRVEKDASLVPSHEEAQIATARAIGLFFDSSKVISGGEWKESVDRWLEGRIRKVARRARGNEWEAVKKLDGIYASYGKAEVIVLPPHPNFEPPAEVKKLQVSGLDLAHDETIRGSNDCGVCISVNPDLAMSTGKSLAQVGHGVQLAIFNSDKDSVESWRANNMPINLCAWDKHDGEWTAEVHDAGFTEIPAGSLTVKSFLKY